ncbi:MAG: AbrB/MazE/SpoVT family DNA-binding domain-containing protein [Patescibacteria group bacterium]
MARRSIPDENIRSIQKSRRSYYITLPIQIIREFGWQEQQEVIVIKRGKEIIIKYRN